MATAVNRAVDLTSKRPLAALTGSSEVRGVVANSVYWLQFGEQLVQLKPRESIDIAIELTTGSCCTRGRYREEP